MQPACRRSCQRLCFVIVGFRVANVAETDRFAISQHSRNCERRAEEARARGERANRRDLRGRGPPRGSRSMQAAAGRRATRAGSACLRSSTSSAIGVLPCSWPALSSWASQQAAPTACRSDRLRQGVLVAAPCRSAREHRAGSLRPVSCRAACPTPAYPCRGFRSARSC